MGQNGSGNIRPGTAEQNSPESLAFHPNKLISTIRNVLNLDLTNCCFHLHIFVPPADPEFEGISPSDFPVNWPTLSQHLRGSCPYVGQMSAIPSVVFPPVLGGFSGVQGVGSFFGCCSKQGSNMTQEAHLIFMMLNQPLSKSIEMDISQMFDNNLPNHHRKVGPPARQP